MTDIEKKQYDERVAELCRLYPDADKEELERAVFIDMVNEALEGKP
jgi:hypothetical protein